MRLRPFDACEAGKLKYLTLTTDASAGKVWTPDTFFRNEKKHRRRRGTLGSSSAYVRIFPGGEVLLSVRWGAIRSRIQPW